jgi:hypothetical protein
MLISAFVAILVPCATCAASRPADLAKIERRLVKEPSYKNKPKYLLLVFGRNAEHKVWLVLDGDTLYVDRHASGDLTSRECRVQAQNEDRSTIFKAGDMEVGGRKYADLQLVVSEAKDMGNSPQAEMPMFKSFLSNYPGGKLYAVAVDVPCDEALVDLRTPIPSIRHYAAEYDNNGILQFAARPEQASIIHFGGSWRFWPDGQQRLVRGRNEDLVLRLGSAGLGPGTSTSIAYDKLIPSMAKPRLRIEYPAARGDRPFVQDVVLKDRC